jgi:hypothetical protein
MIDRAFGHARLFGDVIDGGGGKAALAEQQASRLQNRFDGRGPPLCLCRIRP